MIVTCERCEQRYKIREEKLPPQGGKIRCPTCRHVFIVRPDGTQAESSDAVAATETPISGASEPAKPKAAAAATAEPTNADAAKPAAKAEEASDDKETWKLRVSGLTYAFQDLDSLQTWLTARDSVKGIKVAKGADGWKELGDYPDVLSIALLSKFFPMGDVPTSKDGESVPEPQKPSKEPKGSSESAGSSAKGNSDDKAKGQRKARQQPRKPDVRRPRPETEESAFAMTPRARKLLIAAVVLIALAVVAQFAGWLNLTALVPGLTEKKSEAIDTSATATSTAKPKGKKKTARVASGVKRPGDETEGPREVGPTKVVYVEGEEPDSTEPPEVIEDKRTPEEIRADKVKQVRVYLESKSWEQARGFLEPLMQVTPDDLELNQAMLEVYIGLGLEAEHPDLAAKVFAAKMERGNAFVESKSWAKARAFLEPLLMEHPDDLELNQAMLKVYKGLGLSDQHDDLKTKVAALQRAAKKQEKP